MFVSSLITALLFQAAYVASHGSMRSWRQAAPAPPLQCTTIYGQKCVFPFTYKGKTYYECTTDNSENGQPWCAYETYSDGVAIPNRWEDCNRQTCALQEPPRSCSRTTSGPDAGSKCIFPFSYQGQTYYSCAQWRWGGHGYGKTWCSTRTDRYGRHINGKGYYGFCDDSCSTNSYPSNGGYPAPTSRIW